MKNKILAILAVLAITTACKRDYTCECKYSSGTKTHTVEAKDRFIAIGKCKSDDAKCHFQR